MKIFILFLVLIYLIFSDCSVRAGLITKNHNLYEKAGYKNSEDESGSDVSNIPVRDNVYKLIQKRQKEAYKLIEEGKELIKKGEKRKNQKLISKGQIKKEIGEKQIALLKEQKENKRQSDHEW